MLRIDNNLLKEVGLDSLPDSEKNSLLRHIYETLEMRVGIRLADQMTDQQLDEFEHYFETKDDAGAFRWLETNFPNYKEIVQQEYDKLKVEVAQSAPQILSSSTAPQVAAPPQPVADTSYYAQPQYQMPPQPQAAYSAADQTNSNSGYTAPAPPVPPVPRDINMPMQPQTTNYQSPGQAYTQPNPMPPQNLPPFPKQQPPAGPGPSV